MSGTAQPTMFLDTSSNFYPYECDGPGKCLHCDRRITENHDPKGCALCEDDGTPDHFEGNIGANIAGGRYP